MLNANFIFQCAFILLCMHVHVVCTHIVCFANPRRVDQYTAKDSMSQNQSKEHEVAGTYKYVSTYIEYIHGII